MAYGRPSQCPELISRIWYQPHIRKIGAAHGSGLGRIRSVVEHDCAWLLANKRLDRRHDRRGHIVSALLAAAWVFIAANRLEAF